MVLCGTQEGLCQGWLTLCILFSTATSGMGYWVATKVILSLVNCKDPRARRG